MNLRANKYHSDTLLFQPPSAERNQRIETRELCLSAMIQSGLRILLNHESNVRSLMIGFFRELSTLGLHVQTHESASHRTEETSSVFYQRRFPSGPQESRELSRRTIFSHFGRQFECTDTQGNLTPR